jgi:hypothetical protein
MNHALTYSLISHLNTQVPELTEVVWIYDGVSLTNRTKPFGTIESLTDTSEVIAAGRTAYTETYAWTVGVRARNITERERLVATVITALRQRNIEFIDTRTYPPTASTQTFVADVIRSVPMPLEDISNETDKFRAYIDVEVEIQRENANGLAFSQ